VPKQPRSGMTRNGCACALPTPELVTAATGSLPSPASPPQARGLRLLPTLVAGAFNDGESVESWLARRARQKKLGRNGNGIGTPLAIAIRLLPTPLASDGAAERSPQLGGRRPSGTKRQIGLPEVIACHLTGPAGHSGPAQATAGRERLLPTPDTGTSPHGHGRRRGRPGNGHQSGNGLDTAARTLTDPGPAPGASGHAVAWGEYEPAIRRWEQVLGRPAPPPARPRRTRLSAAFAEWLMGIPHLVTGVPGIPRTAQLRIIGNGVVPHQAAAALRLLTGIAAVPGAPPMTGTSMRAAA
jgi:DNA (cytosine-5)-methyltransferase 1